MRQLTVALLGNPNCGKSTLFNALTGSHQQIGNWPGVTVERKSGFFTEQDNLVEIVDLPGIYSLTAVSSEQALDTQIACEYLITKRPDIVVNVIDAAHLERHLYLTLQLLEMKVPVIIALNMMDVAKKQNIHIDIKRLAEQLGCPVVPLQSRKRQGVLELKQTILVGPPAVSPLQLYSPEIQEAIEQLTLQLNSSSTAMKADYLAARLLENDHLAQQHVGKTELDLVAKQQQVLAVKLGEEVDIIFADLRYSFIHQLLAISSQKQGRAAYRITAWLDRIVLNRIAGIPIFLAVMYSLFFFAINIGGAFQDFFDIGSNTLFVDGLSYLLNQWQLPSWLNAILAGGLGKGINTTVAFIPVIGTMFLFLAFLEASGYMARAAFVMDRLMRALGLPGKSFIPMIIGFGCNVPAVMAARTLENKRERILTVLMAPFMSCGARMAIYAIFTTAFFPHQGQNVVFALYLLGIVMAIATGFILRKTLLRGETTPLILELPPYHMPAVHLLLRQAWQRLKSFILKAGKLIVPFCAVLGGLNAISFAGSINLTDGAPNSLLSLFGQWLTPLFAPMGIQLDNWPATVGLLTGVLAKEVVIGTLNSLYTQAADLATIVPQNFDLWNGLKEAWQSIPDNLAGLVQAIQNPLLASMPSQEVSREVYGEMYQRFGGPIGAFAYLLFVLLYLPCVSTVAVIAREIGRGWAVFSTCWSTLLAYGAAVIFYQAATFNQHPSYSLSWILSLVTIVGIVVLGLWFYSKHKLAQS